MWTSDDYISPTDLVKKILSKEFVHPLLLTKLDKWPGAFIYYIGKDRNYSFIREL
jgi:hypothetical protein